MSKYDKYFVFDEPIPYKKLLIYPVKIKYYMEFLYLSSCLLLEKNSIKDPIIAVKAISMSYMEYLFMVSNDENRLILLFDGLLRLVLNKVEDKEFEISYEYGEDKKPLFKIGNETYNSEDFNNLREIISEQNSLSLPDEKIQKEVREKMEEARRFKERLNKNKTASFEELIMALSLYTGWELSKIYDMTIRKFSMALQRANHMVMSTIYLTASMSGFVTFKDKSILKGWLSDLEEKDKYKDVTMSLDSITKKVSGEEAKENKK